MGEMEKIVEILEKRYPDLMVVDHMDEWERAKLAGKVELIAEIKVIIEEGLSEGK